LLRRPFLGSREATELPKPYVKWSCEPARAQDVPLALLKAHTIAMQHPRGPGHSVIGKCSRAGI